MTTLFATSTSAFYDRAKLDLTSLRTQAEDLQSQISSEKRLTKSSDDPLAASQLRALSRADALAKVDTDAASRATTDLNLVDSALTQFASYVTRAQELATQAATSTLTSTQRASIGSELTQIQGNLVALSNSRDSAGHALFGGDSAGDAYKIDAAGNASYIGTGSAGQLSLGDGQSVTRTMTGPEFLSFSVNGTPTDLMAVVKTLGDTLQAGGAGATSAARTALDALGTGLDSITTAQTVIGARLSWIDLNTQRQTAMGETRSNQQSDLGATDMTASLTRLQELSTVLQASQASFAKLSGLSLFSLIA